MNNVKYETRVQGISIYVEKVFTIMQYNNKNIRILLYCVGEKDKIDR